MMDLSIKEIRGMNELIQIIAHAQGGAATFTFYVHFRISSNIVSIPGVTLAALEQHVRGRLISTSTMSSILYLEAVTQGEEIDGRGGRRRH